MAQPHDFVHVAVDSVNRGIWPTDSIWFKASTAFAALAAIATSVLALLTRGLAVATKNMATKTASLAAETTALVTETKDSIDQAERHHQQSQTPVVSIKVDCKISQDIPGQVLAHMKISGEITNGGVGPAVDVRVHFKPNGSSAKVLQFGVIAAGARDKIDGRLIRSFKEGYPGVNTVPYDCIIVYQTIFGTYGAIRQHSHSGLAEDAKMEEHILPSDDSKTRIDRMIAEGAFAEGPQ